MSDLTFVEKTTIENFLKMGSGYVMDFTDRTFREFIIESIGLDIDDPKFHNASNSKANRLRMFFKVESNYVVGRLLASFCDYWLTKAQTGVIDYRGEENLFMECKRISDRLGQDTIVQSIEAIKPNSEDKDFKLLAKSIRESIEKNEPEAALDRLHTFTMKYIRELCNKHQVDFDRSDSLNAILGKYIKYLIENKHIESQMTEKILKYSIHVIEAFNDIRNNKSYAHDNPILNYNESVLIFNSVSNTIKFIESIENSIMKVKESDSPEWSDLPF